MNNQIWANHIITAISERNGTIIELKVWNHTGTKLVNETILSKSSLIQKLKSGQTVITAYKTSPDKPFLHGAKVVVYQDIHGNDQLRTISNQLSPDNLDNLPKF